MLPEETFLGIRFHVARRTDKRQKAQAKVWVFFYLTPEGESCLNKKSCPLV